MFGVTMRDICQVVLGRSGAEGFGLLHVSLIPVTHGVVAHIHEGVQE